MLSTRFLNAESLLGIVIVVGTPGSRLTDRPSMWARARATARCRGDSRAAADWGRNRVARAPICHSSTIHDNEGSPVARQAGRPETCPAPCNVREQLTGRTGKATFEIQ